MSAQDVERAAVALAEGIERSKETIERVWLERVERAVSGRPGVALTQLRNAMPDYLDGLVRLLRDTRPHELHSVLRGGWAHVAREHGVTRVRQGFDISQLVHEFRTLRQVIREVTQPLLPAGCCPESILADCIDAAIAESVQAYVEARDLEMRRAQAESIGFLTHELRNPLSVATLAVRSLRAGEPERERAIGAIERACVELTRLIDSVLLTERLEAGAVRSQPRRVELGRVLEPALEKALVVAQHKGLQLEADFDPALALWVDPDLTRSALQNVVDNAVKYTDAGSVRVRAEDGREHVIVHVRDECHGLSPEELRTIFEPFKRGKTRKSGSGLGLAIARRAMEAQGGSIGAESPGPFGCHFWLILPKPGAAQPK